jgi:hypothetical protein
VNLFNIRNTFETKEAKGWSEVYFCVDLHGTIIPPGKDASDKTDALKFYPDARIVLQWLSRRKDIVMILWTSTPVDRLVPIWQWLNNNDVYFDYLNRNPHAKDTPRSDFSKKFYANVLLDDHAGFEPMTDWTKIKQELIDIGEWDKT